MNKSHTHHTFAHVDRLEEELQRSGILTADQFRRAKELKNRTGDSLGHILIREGFITEDKLLRFAGQRIHIPYINMDDYVIDPHVIKKIPVELARKYSLIPLFQVENVLTIATSDPINIIALDEIQKVVNCQIDLVLSTTEKITKAIETCYGEEDYIEQQFNEFVSAKPEDAEKEDRDKNREQLLAKMADEPGIAKIVNSIIWQALNDRASDIHLDPLEQHVALRFRIDGRLIEMKKFEKRYLLPLISRVKVIADMDIAQSRIPQDGGVKLKFNHREVELRIATYPTIHGEAMTIRLLATKNKVGSLEELGLTGDALEGVRSILKKRHGIFLVTGPTGSGKSTTLYTLLGKINSEDKHIISIEDPVEMDIPRVNQAKINTKAGLTFASALRSMLRHDPDVIMVGEIRDSETAQLALQAAVTGHLVLSSLHTNDAMSSIARLVNLGVDPFLLATAMEGILNQRLARLICPECKVKYTASRDELKESGISLRKDEVALYKGKGCQQCKNTGYLGRIGIFEWLPISEETRQFILQIASQGNLTASLLNKGGKSLRSDGFRKVLRGMTTIEEVLNATQGD